MATLSDIAKKANLSISTVSRVLSYDHSLSVTDETRKKVFEIAEKLNYTKYKNKSIKKEDNSKRIAIIQWLDEFQEIDDVYYMSIRIGAEKKAEELGYTIIKNPSLDSDNFNDLMGILAIGLFNENQVKQIKSLNENVVFIGTNYPLDDFDTINGDFARATELALEFLRKNGHKKIGLIGAENQSSLFGYRKYRSPSIYTFIDYMKYHNLLNEDWVFVKDTDEPNINVGEELMSKVIDLPLDNRPTAFLIVNDSMALGCMNIMKKNQINIPNDISIIGINDLAVTKFTSPRLSTVKIFTEEMGEIGMETLDYRIHNSPLARRITIAPYLLNRETVASI